MFVAKFFANIQYYIRSKKKINRNFALSGKATRYKDDEYDPNPCGKIKGFKAYNKGVYHCLKL